ncbi:helix-turn-helix domain-containing protein [uncultured Corynebacterium sp.]|uniref:helix-turn-helix domain-containing protein n=1 Tax=uncultured Corynebacterium sp. TaxID=159447 RepID=UPI002593C9A3|nr:helix-turn-helix domain-containing protein [uncultured Corynebacterium sp.]
MGDREMTIKDLLDADRHLKDTRAEKKQLVANHKQALEDYRQASKRATERVNAAVLARTKLARRAQAEGFSKQEIADILGVAYPTVSRILTGER